MDDKNHDNNDNKYDHNYDNKYFIIIIMTINITMIINEITIFMKINITIIIIMTTKIIIIIIINILNYRCLDLMVKNTSESKNETLCR